MKRITYIIALALTIATYGCSNEQPKLSDANYTHFHYANGEWIAAEPPNGWKIVTDGTLYRWQRPSGSIEFMDEHQSKQAAINSAWLQYEYELKEYSTIWTNAP